MNKTVTFSETKSVAILAFVDRSGFSSKPQKNRSLLRKIFKGKNNSIEWDLEAGFVKLLNRKLIQSEIYRPIESASIAENMEVLSFSPEEISSSENARRSLIAALGTDAIVIGTIFDFNQGRLRVDASRAWIGSGRSGQIGGSGATDLRLHGYLYTASVGLELKIYGKNGLLLASEKLKTAKKHKLGGTKISAFQAVATDRGTEMKLGAMPISKRQIVNPIVKRSELMQIEFGSDRYDETLLGMVTDEMLDRIIGELRETVGPKIEKRNLADEPIEGTIIFVSSDNPDETYIDLGFSDGIVEGQKFRVFSQQSEIEIPIGLIEVIDVRSDRLARVRVIEGIEEIVKAAPLPTVFLPVNNND